jgi:hypothetical protein
VETNTNIVYFDSGDNVLAHEGSSSRVARMMEGMRYERGGKGKYWIPKVSADLTCCCDTEFWKLSATGFVGA